MFWSMFSILPFLSKVMRFVCFQLPTNNAFHNICYSLSFFKSYSHWTLSFCSHLLLFLLSHSLFGSHSHDFHTISICDCWNSFVIRHNLWSIPIVTMVFFLALSLSTLHKHPPPPPPSSPVSLYQRLSYDNNRYDHFHSQHFPSCVFFYIFFLHFRPILFVIFLWFDCQIK